MRARTVSGRLACAVVLAGTAAIATGEAPLPSPAVGLDVSDGVSRGEALAIVGELFRRFVGCGAPGDARRVDDHWEVDTHLGVGGSPGPPVLVHAESGVASWGPGCSLLDPQLLFDRDAVLVGCAY